MIEQIDKMKIKTGLPFPRLCRAFEVNIKTFERWRNLRGKSRPLFTNPGPKKVIPPDIKKVTEEIRSLCRGKKTTPGTRDLFLKYESQLSRRDLAGLLKMAEFDYRVDRRKNMRRVKCLKVGLIWSMDATELGSNKFGVKIFVQNTQDWATSYKLPPIVTKNLSGKQIARLLVKLFKKYGPPLFLKRDNGGNQCHLRVDRVLADWGVIPLNSPPYYPPYNGNIEQGQKELKSTLRDSGFELTQIPDEHLGPYIESAMNDRNHMARPKLKGKTACCEFFGKKDNIKFNRRTRRRIYDWITHQTAAIFKAMKDKPERAIASCWRIAAETWMRWNKLIKVFINGNVLPNFCLKNPNN